MIRTATFLLVLLAAALASACGSAQRGERGAAPAPAPVEEPAARDPAEGIYTELQSDRGRGAFRASCAECHYSSEFRGSRFQNSWGRRSVADLFTEIAQNMPEDAPGSLEDQVYVDIVAYILQLNGFPAGDGELPARLDLLEGYGMMPPARAAGTGVDIEIVIDPHPGPTRAWWQGGGSAEAFGRGPE